MRKTSKTIFYLQSRDTQEFSGIPYGKVCLMRQTLVNGVTESVTIEEQFDSYGDEANAALESKRGKRRKVK